MLKVPFYARMNLEANGTTRHLYPSRMVLLSYTRNSTCLDSWHLSSCDIDMSYLACCFSCSSYLSCSLLSLSPCLGCFSLPCLGPRRVDAGSGRACGGDGTSGLGQIGLHVLCSTVPQCLSPLKPEWDAMAFASISPAASMHSASTK